MVPEVPASFSWLGAASSANPAAKMKEIKTEMKDVGEGEMKGRNLSPQTVDSLAAGSTIA